MEKKTQRNNGSEPLLTLESRKKFVLHPQWNDAGYRIDVEHDETV